MKKNILIISILFIFIFTFIINFNKSLELNEKSNNRSKQISM